MIVTGATMEPIHIFSKELSTDKNNIFTANLAEQNEVVEVKFRKSREYAVTVLSINQDIHSDLVEVTDTDRQEAISNLTQRLVKQKKDPDLDLRMYNEEAFEKIIPSKKKYKSDIRPIKLSFYNMTTKNKKKLNSTTICFT